MEYWFGVPDVSVETTIDGGGFDYWYGVPIVRYASTAEEDTNFFLMFD